MAVGRPSKYSDEIAQQICEKIATTSLGLKAISKELKIPLSTITQWLYDGKYPKFTELYARAKEAQADLLVEQMMEIADTEHRDLLEGEFGMQGNPTAVQRDRLKIDARKWAASKLAPKKYGDKVEHSGSLDVAVTGMKIV